MNTLNYYDVLLRPIVTEKTTSLASQAKYVFCVLKQSNKLVIKRAIEKLFEVKVEQVNIINKNKKIKRFKGIKGEKSGYKKAIVTLKEGEKIEYEVGVK